jgi:cytochrome P450
MRAFTQELTLRIILTLVFGTEASDRCLRLQQQLSEFLDLFNSPLYTSTLFFPSLQKDWGDWSPWGHFKRRKQQIRQLMSEEITERRSQPPSNDILGLLMAATDEDGNGLEESEIIDELMTLLFAGHETTASALAWAFYWLCRYPETYHHLVDELAIADLDGDPAEVAKLPYLGAVISESLRIYPSALFTFGRTTKTALDWMGYALPEGTAILPCIYLVHHHPETYPQSQQFRPERFLERQFSPYEFIPFGGRNRRCLGYALALFEMKLVLATVLKQVKLQLLETQPVRPVRRGFTLSPSGGIKMQVAKFIA